MTAQAEIRDLEKFDDLAGSQTAEPKSYDIDLRGISAVLRRRKWLMLAIVATAVLMAYLALQAITPQYKSTAALLIDTRRVQILNIEPVMGTVPVDLNIIQSEVDALSSRFLASKIIEKLGLSQDPEFNAALREPSMISGLHPSRWLDAEWRDYLMSFLPEHLTSSGRTAVTYDTTAGEMRDVATVDAFLNNLSVSNDRRSYTIWVSFRSENPVKAARITNALVEQYIAEQLDDKLQFTNRVTSWLDERLGLLRDKVQQSEMAVQEFRERWSLRETKGQTISDQQKSELNSQLVNAKTELATAEAKLRGAKQLIQNKSIESASQVLASPVIQKLIEQRTLARARQAEIETKLGARHPSALAIKAELSDLNSLIQEEATKIVRALESEADVAKARTNTLTASLTELQTEQGKRSQIEVQLAQLEREANADRSLYETFLNRFKETSEGGKIENADAKLISPGMVPKEPSSPKKAAILGMSAVASLFFSIFLIVLLERLNNCFQNSREVEDLTGVPSWHLIPELPRHKRHSPFEYVLHRPTSAYAEALQTVRTELKALGIAGRQSVMPCLAILVTSAMPGEGKSTFVSSLARVVARSGLRVLLIDADLRRASASDILGVPCEGGLEAVIAGGKAFADTIYKDEESGLDILPCRRTRNNPLDILSAAGMSDLLSLIRREYQVVFIDSPPVAAVPDALALAPLVDSTIFLIRWNSTPRDLVISCINRLRRSGTKIASALLTRVDLNKQAKYGNDRDGRHYKRYKQYYTN
jgi:capsular exopolysaccharide synthesis family protein